MKQTIDLTPTWSNILPLLILGIQEGDYKTAKEELERMAAIADKYVEQMKKGD